MFHLWGAITNILEVNADLRCYPFLLRGLMACSLHEGFDNRWITCQNVRTVGLIALFCDSLPPIFWWNMRFSRQYFYQLSQHNWTISEDTGDFSARSRNVLL